MDELNKDYDKIEIVNIEKEMRQSYINYAMSVIVARALPDVRDGLKPVHRRILFAMSELNLEPNKAYRKSARIVGDTMGKYHPHGNTSIYDAMVRLAQDFSMRYMLVDGHGNFGSLDGDSAAAERYTEARLTKLSVEMLADIEKDTVDFVPNFDETEKEPTVLPSRFPNLLVNGSSGIAVGMATNIPPHNLGEIIDAVLLIIDNEINGQVQTDITDLIKIVKGPDFPTGASILGMSGIQEAYLTGRGKIRVRATASIEPMQNDREQIVVTEIPYQVNKAKMVEKISDLVKEKRIDGISDLRDESNRNGIRVVIELKKDVKSAVVLNQLYKYTQMEESFGVIMLALVDNEPKVLNLKEMLVHYISHQKVVVTRRTQFELNKAQKRAHILEGLRIALDHIDEVINIIRSSQNTQIAKERLQERFDFSDEQAAAIVDMRLRALTGLEREKIDQEYNELMELIKDLNLILSSEKRLYEVIREEILIIKTKYADERRTKIEHDETEIMLEDLIEEEQMVVTLSSMDYVKRVPLTTYKSQNRGGKGIMAMQTRDSDFVKDLFVASTHDYMLFFTSKGKVYRLKTYEIPETSRNAKGTAIVNLLELDQGERVSAVVPVNEYDEGSFLVMTTKNGVIKKTRAKEFNNIRKGGLIALNIRTDDALISVKQTDGTKNILVTSKNGMSVMFNESRVRSMGRTAAGVTAIRLANGDSLVASEIIDESSRVLFVTSKGFGKCTDISAFRLQNRGGKGLKSYKITPKTGDIVGVLVVNDDDQLMMITSEGIVIRIRVNEISTQRRVTQGVKLMNVDEGVLITGVAKINADVADEPTEEFNGDEITSVEIQTDDIVNNQGE